MSYELHGHHDIVPYRLIPRLSSYEYVFTSAIGPLYVTDQGFYTTQSNISAMILYGTAHPTGNIVFEDGKTLRFPGNDITFEGSTGNVTCDVESVYNHFSFQIKNVSFFENFEKVSNSFSDSQLLFNLEHNTDFTLWVDYATDEPSCGRVRIGQTSVPLDSTDLNIKQVALEVRDDMITRYFTDTPEDTQQFVHEPDTDRTSALNVARQSPWSTFRCYNIAAFKGFSLASSDHETSHNNVCIGHQTGRACASRNVYIGNHTGEHNKGSHNLIVGDEAGATCTDCHQTVSLGHASGSDGYRNVYVGHHTGSTTATLHDNIWIGANLSGDESETLRIGSWLYGGHSELRVLCPGLRTNELFSGNIHTDNLFIGNIHTSEHFTGNVANVSHFQANVGNVNHLQANVANVSHFQANVANVSHFQANVANVSHFTGNVANVSHFTGNVANVSHFQANVANVSHLHAPEFTDGSLTITNGNIQGVQSLELNDTQMFFENGKLKFRWEGKTYVVQSDLE